MRIVPYDRGKSEVKETVILTVPIYLIGKIKWLIFIFCEAKMG